MPPLPPSSSSLPSSILRQSASPRIVLYQQTHHHDSQAVSLLPLLTGEQTASVSHLILAAVHINSDPAALTLNDHPPDHARFTQLWDEVLALQDSGTKVSCMLGGAAQGSFTRLDYDPSELAALQPLSGSVPLVDDSVNNYNLPPPRNFEPYYATLRDFIRTHNLQGIDLDVEEAFSLHGIVHLIDRLRADFGSSSSGFVITLAPVATALIAGAKHLSGFDYFELERLRGPAIDWYNVQFYNGWGSLAEGVVDATGATWGWYDRIVNKEGWSPHRLVLGLLTNSRHGGSGYVGWDVIARRIGELTDRYPAFGGVMGWEYWAAVPDLEDGNAASTSTSGNGDAGSDEESHYWRWAWRMRWLFGLREIRDHARLIATAKPSTSSA